VCPVRRDTFLVCHDDLEEFYLFKALGNLSLSMCAKALRSRVLLLVLLAVPIPSRYIVGEFSDEIYSYSYVCMYSTYVPTA